MKMINSTCLKGIVLAAALGNMPAAQAQENTVRPFVADQAVTERLFNLEELGVNYHFTAELGGGNVAIIEFNRLSDWSNKGELEYIISTAQKYYAKVQDSFKHATTSKRLDLHIPLENEPVTARMFEYMPNNSIVLLKGDMQSPLKLTMDTVRVLRTTNEISVHKKKQFVQMQYTILLKDIDDIQDLAGNKALLANVEDKFDSVVRAYRIDWSNQNKWTHNLNVTYYPLGTDPRKQLSVKRIRTDDENGKFYKAFEWDFGVGLTFFRNTPCPLVDWGLSYRWPTRSNQYVYLRFSNTTFSNIVWKDTYYNAYGVSFGNLEFGWMKNKTYTRIPLYKASIGFGFSQNLKGNNTYFDPTLDEYFGKMFASYSLSKIFTVTWEQYFSFTTSNHGFTGVSVVARLW
jgi:hypothetical protein